MRTADHLYLGKYLAENYLSDKPKGYQKAFVMGNVFPDINFFTYFRGALGSKSLKGHNYENVSEAIKRIEEKLVNCKCYGYSEYFSLGVLVHYTADSFTFPHNRCFDGSLKKHIEYEDELHYLFLDRMKDMKKFEFHIYPEHESFYSKLNSLHKNYLLNIGNMNNDITYILKASMIAICKIMGYSENRTKEDWRYVS